MRVRVHALLLILVLLGPQQSYGQTQDDLRAEIDQIRVQLAEMEQLKARLAELERRVAESPPPQNPPVTTSYPNERARIDGRIFVGLFDSGDEGQFPNWSTDINDARLRFTFNPSDRVTIVSRLNASGASAGDFDYLYLDYADVLGTTDLRIGQRKIDVGQETWMDNPVEGILITPSASRVSGYGTGIALLGSLGTAPNAPIFELGFVNGPRGVMVRPTSGLPINVKVGMSLANKLFASASYYDSGSLGGIDNSAISVADITSAPAGAAEWTRRLWEVDLRYNYGTTGVRPLVPVGNLPRLMIGATYGSFDDDAVGVDNRSGDFWFVEGFHGLSSRLYAAARYSTVTLDDGAFAQLARSPVAVNSYRRTSLGLGYALTDLAVIKAEYTWNSTTGAAEDPSLDQWAVGIASKF